VRGSHAAENAAAPSTTVWTWQHQLTCNISLFIFILYLFPLPILRMINYKRGIGFKWRWRRGRKKKKENSRGKGEERKVRAGTPADAATVIPRWCIRQFSRSWVWKPRARVSLSQKSGSKWFFCLVAALGTTTVSLQRPMRRAAASRQDRAATRLLHLPRHHRNPGLDQRPPINLFNTTIALTLKILRK